MIKRRNIRVPLTSLSFPNAQTHSIKFFPKLEHLVHVDIYRQIIVWDGLFGLHQPLSDNLHEKHICMVISFNF